MPRESAMSRLTAGSALRVAGPPARRLMIPVHLIAAEAFPGSRHAGPDVLGEETRGRVVVDERLVSEPLDSSAAGTGVAEGIPRGQEVRVLLVQFVFEPAEGALALDSPRQPPPGSLVADLLGEVGHVLVPDVGRQRMYADQVQFVEVNGGVAVDPGVGCPENDLSGLWVDQPPVLVAGLVRQRDGDLPEIKAAQLKHQTTVFPCKPGRPTLIPGRAAPGRVAIAWVPVGPRAVSVVFSLCRGLF